MITLAGHGKDDRLIQVELPIVPDMGDRIREDCNSTEWPNKLKSLITEGEFIEIEEKYGSTFWKVKLSNGKFALMAPEDTVIIGRAPVLVEKEICLESLLERKQENVIEGDENYTPDYFLAPCKKFLAGIDLDPFSCEIANKTIGAVNIYTREDDALIQNWTQFNRKWVNPPYSSRLIGKAIAKTLEYSHIGETLLLVNTSSSAKWFQACMEKCSAYLHPSKRINFDSPFRTSKGNRYDQTLFYFGDRPLEFAEVLSTLGNAVQPIKKLCLPTSTSLEASELSLLQVETLAKSQPSAISTSAKTRRKSINPSSIKSPPIPTSESITQAEALTSSLVDFPAREQAPQVAKLDLTTQTLPSGLSISDVSMKDTPGLSSSRIPLDYFIGEWERSLQAYPQAGTMRSGKFSALPCLEVPKKGKEFLSLPTLTTGLGKTRNAGATKCEKFLKDKDILQDIQALSVEMMAILFGFPMDWALCLLESPKESRAGITLEPCLDEQSISIAPPSPLNESSTSIGFSGNNIDASSSAKLSFLLEQRDRLISSGASAQGIWINCGKVPNRDFKQAVWKSDKPRPEWSNKKSQYIGKFKSDLHLSAIAQHRAGQELRKVEREIKSIEKKS